MEPEVDPDELEEMMFDRFEDIITKRMLDNRMLYFTGEVDLDKAKSACRHLEYMASVNDEPITIVLNSVGGEVYAGLLLYNTIKDIIDNRGIDINIEARGLVASVATIVLQAGSKRLSAKRTRFLLHEVMHWSYGKSSELEEESKEVKTVNRMLAEILAERSGKKTETILKDIKKKEFWMSAEDALSYGLIDEVV